MSSVDLRAIVSSVKDASNDSHIEIEFRITNLTKMEIDSLLSNIDKEPKYLEYKISYYPSSYRNITRRRVTMNNKVTYETKTKDYSYDFKLDGKYINFVKSREQDEDEFIDEPNTTVTRKRTRFVYPYYNLDIDNSGDSRYTIEIEITDPKFIIDSKDPENLWKPLKHAISMTKMTTRDDSIKSTIQDLLGVKKIFIETKATDFTNDNMDELSTLMYTSKSNGIGYNMYQHSDRSLYVIDRFEVIRKVRDGSLPINLQAKQIYMNVELVGSIYKSLDIIYDSSDIRDKRYIERIGLLRRAVDYISYDSLIFKPVYANWNLLKSYQSWLEVNQGILNDGIIFTDSNGNYGVPAKKYKQDDTIDFIVNNRNQVLVKDYDNKLVKFNDFPVKTIPEAINKVAEYRLSKSRDQWIFERLRDQDKKEPNFIEVAKRNLRAQVNKPSLGDFDNLENRDYLSLLIKYDKLDTNSIYGALSTILNKEVKAKMDTYQYLILAKTGSIDVDKDIKKLLNIIDFNDLYVNMIDKSIKETADIIESLMIKKIELTSEEHTVLSSKIFSFISSIYNPPEIIEDLEEEFNLNIIVITKGNTYSVRTPDIWYNLTIFIYEGNLLAIEGHRYLERSSDLCKKTLDLLQNYL